jgi:hypothetical protein
VGRSRHGCFYFCRVPARRPPGHRASLGLASREFAAGPSLAVRGYSSGRSRMLSACTNRRRISSSWATAAHAAAPLSRCRQSLLPLAGSMDSVSSPATGEFAPQLEPPCSAVTRSLRRFFEPRWVSTHWFHLQSAGECLPCAIKTRSLRPSISLPAPGRRASVMAISIGAVWTLLEFPLTAPFLIPHFVQNPTDNASGNRHCDP